MLNNLVNNEYIQTKEIIDNFFIKTISIFNDDSDLESFVRKFINIYTFPYINTDYGKIIQNYKADLSDEKKIEITAHLEALLNNLNKAKKTAFMKLKDEEIIELTEADIDELDDKEKLFNNFRGGEYGEMFLSQMLFSLGYEKVLSKLYIQWGELSPTGVDVPYIDIKQKKLVLCESKFWKNFNKAFKSIKKDIDDIIDYDKFDNEIVEWKKRISSMPDNIKSWFKENKEQAFSKAFFESNYEIIVFGVVICNKIDFKNIREQIKSIFGEDNKKKYTVILTAIPIEDKNKLIAMCEKCVKNVLDEVKSYDRK